MENFNYNNSKINKHLIAGIFLVVLGGLFMLKGLGVLIPSWLLSWHTFLLLAGILVGFRRNFKPGGWILMVLVGSIFTLKDILFFDISAYTTALLLMGIGVYMIFKPRKAKQFCDFNTHKQNIDFGQQ